MGVMDYAVEIAFAKTDPRRTASLRMRFKQITARLAVACLPPFRRSSHQRSIIGTVSSVSLMSPSRGLI
jgi:hypothetical protein